MARCRAALEVAAPDAVVIETVEAFFRPEVISPIERLFADIEAGKDLSEFKIAKEAQKGIGSAIVDTLILEPNISGVSISFKKLGKFLSKAR